MRILSQGRSLQGASRVDSTSQSLPSIAAVSSFITLKGPLGLRLHCNRSGRNQPVRVRLTSEVVERQAHAAPSPGHPPVCPRCHLAGLAAQAASAFHSPRATRRPSRKGFGRNLATRLRTSGGRGQTGRFPRSPGFSERESGCPLHPVAVSVIDGKRPVCRPRFPGFRPSTLT